MMTSILVFNFSNEVVCPTKHYLISFKIFRYLETILTVFIKIRTKPKHTVSFPKIWLNASTALGHKLMPSAQS